MSLNVVAYDPAQPWIDQYRFDVEHGTVIGGLTTAPSEALLALAVHFGDGLDLAHHVAEHHSFARMRVTALDAIVSANGHTGRAALERAAASADRVVAAHARARLDAAETDAVQA